MSFHMCQNEIFRGINDILGAVKMDKVVKLSEIHLTFFCCAELVKIKYELIPYFVLISLFLVSPLLLLCLLPFWCH